MDLTPPMDTAKVEQRRKDRAVVAQLGHGALWIGKYSLQPVMDGQQVWIAHESGEGMAIAAAVVEAAIERLWRERF